MTIEEARAIWEPLLGWDEGYLDAQARIERQRPLTPDEQIAADVLFLGFIEAMKNLTRTLTRTEQVAGRG